MKTRMQSIGNDWQKLPRIVRDLSNELGRQIDLDMQGAVEVVEAGTTNESFFFRDKIPFEHFCAVIMPALMAAREKHIRILCTAAAAGQEPYSLAMILKNIGRSLTGWRVEILATDISIAVL
jgi:chemotaxis protein methyltransferase CheR